LIYRETLEDIDAQNLEQSVEAGLQGEALFDDGDEYVDRHRNPDLRLHRVLRNADKAFDAQVLLDPFEKQLDLPAIAIELGDRGGWEAEVVSQAAAPADLRMCFVLLL